MAQTSTSSLDWPNESAAGMPGEAGVLSVPGSNLLLDLHGDPVRARLVVYSDGNHHMALEETLGAFLKTHPEAVDIFYATTPPRIVIDALNTGRMCSGNMVLTIRPHVFIGPDDVLEKLSDSGAIGANRSFMRSNGLSILVAKGNPKRIERVTDLLRDEVRLALSNPVTEIASFSVYAAAIIAFAKLGGQDGDEVHRYLTGDEVVKSSLIHHREIPQILASGRAEASLVYHHLALRYTRIFPDLFDLVPVDLSKLDQPENYLTTYHAALVGDGGEFGAPLIEFMQTDEVSEIYASHGLTRPGSR